MCGIAGIVGLTDKALAGEKIARMVSHIYHRGPDAEGIFVDHGIGLGHTRLAIIDLAESSNQPMFDATGRYAMVFNGEIYNYKDVRARLAGYPYNTESDSETILAAYSEYGRDCVELLNGMFAFAIWDSARQELFIARDRLGVKPLYYSLTADGVLVFASEIRAILGSGLVERRLNSSAISEYLMYQSVYSPRTIVEGVHQLPAGAAAVFCAGEFETRRYWDIEKTTTHDEFTSYIEVKRRVNELLLTSVERRMISDVRLGAFLSGGIDSSAIVAMMSEVSAQPIDTFSVTFDERKFDESPFSKLIAARFNTRHTEVRLTAKDFLEELPNALASTDSPSGDGLNTYVVSKRTKEAGITVALSGVGGDELFAGYSYFFSWLRLNSRVAKNVPAFIRKLAARLLATSARSKYQRLAELLRSDQLSLENTYPMFRQVLSQRSAHKIFANGSGRLTIADLLASKHADISEFPLLSQISIAELLGYTQNILLKDTDQYGMASALEIREPFFDFELVEYVLQIPDAFKFKGYPKSLLVESIAPMLPDAIVHRPKMGFVLPWENWMRNDLREFCRSRIEKLSGLENFDAETLLGRWEMFETGSDSVKWSEFWHLVVLADWIERNGF